MVGPKLVQIWSETTVLGEKKIHYLSTIFQNRPTLPMELILIVLHTEHILRVHSFRVIILLNSGHIYSNHLHSAHLNSA